jgi:dienelactone hydrolase
MVKYAWIVILMAFSNVLSATNLSGIAARSEIYAIPSLTLSDQQFLLGDQKAKEVMVGGILRFPPKPVSEKLPLIFLVHGSSGMGANIDFWSNHFLENGYATFSLDGFTGRGLTVVGPNQASLGRLNLILDSYRALEILQKHPRLDTSKFVMMGFSRGGQAALFSSVQRFNDLWNKSGIRFAAHIPFYADCGTSYISDEKTTGSPIRLHHGKTDDYNPLASCRVYVEKLKKANQDVQLFEYEFGPHAFDSPLGQNPPTVSKNAQTVRNCRIEERTPGILINAETSQPFKYSDACVQLNPHVGKDEEAIQNASLEIDQFLRSLFKN